MTIALDVECLPNSSRLMRLRHGRDHEFVVAFIQGTKRLSEPTLDDFQPNVVACALRYLLP